MKARRERIFIMERNGVAAQNVLTFLSHFTTYMFHLFICSQSHIYLAESSTHEVFECICLDDKTV